jgi:serine/threonine protein phosphatase PrpC
MRFSYRTKKGSVPSNPGKVNQDSHIILPNINSKTWQHFFAICDGHGPLGHYVSGYIKNILPTIVSTLKNLQKSPMEILMKAFEITYQKMIKESHIDLSFSGSTIISCYMMHNKLYCCNVGDSRAIVGKCKDGKWSAMPLSEDHKPSLPK